MDQQEIEIEQKTYLKVEWIIKTYTIFKHKHNKNKKIRDLLDKQFYYKKKIILIEINRYIKR